ncbi:hypothetical protein [Pyrobaculum ferrireducens]|uniref:Uncharacterized protein n=1 Tax=Pyrobaculum ferrireducens TaxID=1104324 RepID=G7VFZ9_9CREN|nr:hypothetical protein [Pyrobaculum ferrireducens]AET31806.1 hypothetical protein P186_0351 [Pyrobaculum ferrireducens]
MTRYLSATLGLAIYLYLALAVATGERGLLSASLAALAALGYSIYIRKTHNYRVREVLCKLSNQRYISLTLLIMILAFATAVYSSINNYAQIFHIVNTINYILGYALLTFMISFFMCIISEHEEETQRQKQQTSTKRPSDTREDN